MKNVACELNNANPELTFTNNPNQAILYKSRNPEYSTASMKPNKRKFNIVNIPTTIANPIT
jgi:hypothetical protein